MSDDAVRHAKAWTHPKATRSIHLFFEAIADRIPQGQTTTPLLTLDELSTASHQVERTARTNRDFLVGIGQVKVHDGGRGIKDARYEMLQLTNGERPIVPAPLPLLGRPKPPKPKKAKGQWRTSDLFADLEAQRSDQTSDLVADVAQTSDLVADVWQKVGSGCRRWIAKVGSGCRRLLPHGGPPATTKYVRTDLLEEEKLVVVADAPARDPADALMTWFEETYPTVHHGASCTVDRSRDGPLVRELLRRPGRTVERLQAMTWLLWSITTDGVFKSDPWWIAERVAVRNIYILHRKADYLDGELTRREQEAASQRDIWAEVLQEVAKRVPTDVFHTWFKSSALVDVRGEVVVVRLKDDPAEHHLAANWIQRNFADVLAESVATVQVGAMVEFEFIAAERKKYG